MTKDAWVDLHALQAAEVERQRDATQERKLKERERARNERQQQALQKRADGITGDGEAVMALKAKIAAGERVTSAQVAAALAKDELASFKAEAEAEALERSQREQFAQAREQLRAASASFAVAREAARDRLNIRIAQATAEFADELEVAATEVKDARARVKGLGKAVGADIGTQTAVDTNIRSILATEMQKVGQWYWSKR